MKKLSARFAQLKIEIDELEKTKKPTQRHFGTYDDVDGHKLLEWRVKAKGLIEKTCGFRSNHLSEFSEQEKEGSYTTHLDILYNLRAIFVAAQNDYDGGFLVSTTNLVAAELFDDQLEQASELLRNGYIMASAVVAGTVLETTLRRLCDLHGIAHGKVDKMNADLAKSGIYTLLVQKRITALEGVMYF